MRDWILCSTQILTSLHVLEFEHGCKTRDLKSSTSNKKILFVIFGRTEEEEENRSKRRSRHQQKVGFILDFKSLMLQINLHIHLSY